MVLEKKKIISIRISDSDHEKIKRIASRIKVNESSIIRLALKVMLQRITPLHDTRKRGKDVLPAFMEFGKEMIHFFELDTERLDAIINDGVLDKDYLISRDDIELIAMAAANNDRYLLSLLREHADPESCVIDDPQNQLREYLFEKYFIRTEG